MATSLRKKYSTILDCASVKNKTKCGWNIKTVNHTKVVRPFMGRIVSTKWKKGNNAVF